MLYTHDMKLVVEPIGRTALGHTRPQAMCSTFSANWEELCCPSKNKSVYILSWNYCGGLFLF